MEGNALQQIIVVGSRMMCFPCCWVDLGNMKTLAEVAAKKLQALSLCPKLVRQYQAPHFLGRRFLGRLCPPIIWLVARGYTITPKYGQGPIECIALSAQLVKFIYHTVGNSGFTDYSLGCAIILFCKIKDSKTKVSKQMVQG